MTDKKKAAGKVKEPTKASKKTTNTRERAKSGKGKEPEASQTKSPKKKAAPRKRKSEALSAKKSPGTTKAKKPVSRKGEIHKRGMTDRAWNFCHYLVQTGRKEHSAILAGYSKRTAASQASTLLKNPKVIKKIDQLKRKLNKKLELKAESVIEEWMRLGYTNLTDLVDMSEGVPRFKDLDQIDPKYLSALQSVSLTANGIKFKMHDKKGALDSLAKHLGLLKEGVSIGTIIIKTDSDDDEL